MKKVKESRYFHLENTTEAVRTLPYILPLLPNTHNQKKYLTFLANSELKN